MAKAEGRRAARAAAPPVAPLDRALSGLAAGRTEIAPGQFRLHDKIEAEFAAWVMMNGVPIDQIDALILDDAAALDGAVRLNLLRERREAFDAYRAGKVDLAVALGKMLNRSSHHAVLAAAAIPVAQAHAKYRTQQQSKAKRPRKRIAAADGRSSGFASISDIIDALAPREDALGDLLPAAELWPLVFGHLDDMGLSPDEEEDPRRYTFDKNDAGERAEIKFTSFSAMLSKARAAPRKLT